MPIVPLRRQLAGDGRADGFDAAEVVVVLQFVADLGDHRLLGAVAGVLRGDADQHFAGAADFLHLDVADVELGQPRADIGRIGAAVLGLELDDRAALEIDAVVHVEA